jgi:hypothetical protein
MRIEAMDRAMNMTAHQKRTMWTRQKHIEYQRQQQVDIAARTREILEEEVKEVDEPPLQTGYKGPWPTVSSAQGPILEAVQDMHNTESLSEENLVRLISAVKDEEVESMLRPLWLHNELFRQNRDGQAAMNEAEDCKTIPLISHGQEKMAIPGISWLDYEIFPQADLSVAEPEPGQISTSQTIDTILEGTPKSKKLTHDPGTSSKRTPRKELKQAKKQRAAEKRALAHTLAKAIAIQEAEEKEVARAKAATKAIKK